jgi:hypothetical protein
MTKHTPQIGDKDYDPSRDPLFLEQVQPPAASTMPAPKPKTKVGVGGVAIGEGYAGTDYTADQLVEMNGTNPDGSPRTDPVPDTPTCPSVSLGDGPFDTTAIPPGCNEPLSAECAAYYNDQRAKAGYPA